LETPTQLRLFCKEEEENYRPVKWRIFLQTELGRLYQTLPLSTLAGLFTAPAPRHPQGITGYFDVQGGLALQILKHHSGMSDAQVIEHLNGNWHWQYFCGIELSPFKQIKDKDMVGRWRRYLASHSDGHTWEKVQQVLVQSWSSQMAAISPMSFKLDDATVYESYIKYPTNVKLLWDCCEWVFERMRELCKHSGVKLPRFEKFHNQSTKQLAYSKLRKKTKKKEKGRRKELLYWLGRGIELMQGLIDCHSEIRVHIKGVEKLHCEQFFERLKTIKQVYFQQALQMKDFKRFKEVVKDRIVSFYKPYLRPIVRGKEGKDVEFGAKAHISQVGGVNFVEHLSFKAFHEGVRLPKSLRFHYLLTKHKCKQFGGDRIYANRNNRALCKKKGIATCFAKQGNPKWLKKDKNQHDAEAKMKRIIGKARATRLEGSFGNQKNHYLLQKVKARKEHTEIVWIYCGIITANAAIIAQKRFDKIKKAHPPPLLPFKAKRTWIQAA
jgi:transposase, IS5 family